MFSHDLPLEEATPRMELLQLTTRMAYSLTGEFKILTLVGESPFTTAGLSLTDSKPALKDEWAFTVLALPQQSVGLGQKSSSPDGSSVSVS